MLRPLQPKLGVLRPLQLKMGMLQLWATEEIFCDFARPKRNMLQFYATQKLYVATIATQNRFVDNSQLSFWILSNFAIKLMEIWGRGRPGSRSGTYFATIATQIWSVATIATQNGYVALLRDQWNFVRVCATQTIYCDLTRPKNGMLRLCATQISYDATLRDQN